MKEYMGVKTIKAEPMEINGKPGYKVVYGPDGYESWSPKDVFEAAYLPLDTPGKISLADVELFMGEVEAEKLDNKTTLVKAETLTGFREYQTCSCVNPANHDHEIGKSQGAKRIQDTIWMCLGFVMQWGLYGLKGEARDK